MSLRTSRASCTTRSHSTADLKQQSVSARRSAYIGTAVRQTPCKQSKAIKAGAAAKQIKCQAFEYNLDPSIAKFDYQPAELPTATVQTYDFLVLGSGIAGLTYALKVSLQASLALLSC